MNFRSIPVVGGAAREVAPWIEAFARIGFVAKGVLYMTVSALAASAALGVGGKHDADSHTALQKLFAAPFGRVLVAVVALGLVGYSLWRIIEGITDPQRRGHDVKGLAIRASYIARGLIHLALAAAAGALAVYRQDNGGGGKNIEEWTSRTLGIPFGRYIVLGVAGGLFAYGIYQLWKAARAKLSRQLELGRVRARRVIVGISRFGIAARGIVFCTIAVLVGRAARDYNPKEAGGLGDSMRELFAFGKWPFLAIALGLGAYGIYELVNAKYRRIDIA